MLSGGTCQILCVLCFLPSPGKKLVSCLQIFMNKARICKLLLKFWVEKEISFLALAKFGDKVIFYKLIQNINLNQIYNKSRNKEQVLESLFSLCIILRKWNVIDLIPDWETPICLFASVYTSL